MITLNVENKKMDGKNICFIPISKVCSNYPCHFNKFEQIKYITNADAVYKMTDNLQNWLRGTCCFILLGGTKI